MFEGLHNRRIIGEDVKSRALVLRAPKLSQARLCPIPFPHIVRRLDDSFRHFDQISRDLLRNHPVMALNGGFGQIIGI